MSQTRRPKYQHLFKVIIVGAGKVGKTSLTIRFAEDRFRESYLPTLGVDFLTKNLTINDKHIKLQLWDTGGQEFVMSLLPFYFSGAAGGVLVYDITNRNSFNSLDYWLKQIRQNAGDIPVTLAGNKIDISEQRKVSTEEAQAFAKEKKLFYIETSAKTGVSVPDIFDNLIKVIMERELERSIKRASAKKDEQEEEEEFSFWQKA
ncbi:MAG TPA: Rab family GTPase [candidate division Zixibacteria bacterium]|nr:Rab family GTPase [candidate division Zixibacteria bacterium]